MEYSDAENIRWWQGLTSGDRTQLCVDVAEKARANSVAEACTRAIYAIQAGSIPQAKDIGVLRKWWHR